MIKPTRKKKYSDILAAVDVMGSGKGPNKLNTKIMELSSSLARIEGSKLHIVHSWNQPLEGGSRRYTGLSAKEMSEIIDETRQLHERLFLEFMGRFDLKKVSYKTHLLKGQPGLVIAELANRKRIDLVVMGTVSRGGISGLLIGNTAERVLSGINASVLTVKPDNFKTPVK
jgi:nucleotide-binding universal stress UspA family protein